MTLIYIHGHVMLYVGNNGSAITYQDVWGMSPKNRDKRYVIGQSIFFPLLKTYPENTDVASLAGRDVFQLVFLDALLLKRYTPRSFAAQFLAERRPNKN